MPLSGRAIGGVALLWGCGGHAEPDPGRAEPVRSHESGVVRFVVLGDTGTGEEGQWVVQRQVAQTCAALGCDAVLLLGDVLYPSGMVDDDPADAEARIASYTSIAPTWVVLGNHEYGDGVDDDAADRLVAWARGRDDVHLPARRWTADFDGGRLVGLDTHTVFRKGESVQGPWLAEELATIDGWRVVLGHHPWLSSGTHGDAGRYEGWRYVPWLSGRSLRRMFDAELCGRADLYLAGHDHHLEVRETCGVVLAVSGGGAKTRPLETQGVADMAASRRGFMWMELRGARGVLRVFDDRGDELYARPLTRGLRPPP